MPLPNKRQAKLLEVLRDYEASNKSFTIEQLVQLTDYPEKSIRTYLSKKLLGRFVVAAPNEPGRFVARDLRQLPNADFAAIMSQKGSFDLILHQLEYLSRSEWERAVEVLVRVAERRAFDVGPLLERLEARARPPVSSRDSKKFPRS